MLSVEYVVHLIAYEFLLLPCIMPFALLDAIVPDSDRTAGLWGVVHVVSVAGMVAVLILNSWLSHRAAQRRVLSNSGFFQALAEAWHEGRVNASYLPLVGPWLGYRRPDDSRDSGPVE